MANFTFFILLRLQDNVLFSLTFFFFLIFGCVGSLTPYIDIISDLQKSGKYKEFPYSLSPDFPNVFTSSHICPILSCLFSVVFTPISQPSKQVEEAGSELASHLPSDQNNSEHLLSAYYVPGVAPRTFHGCHHMYFRPYEVGPVIVPTLQMWELRHALCTSHFTQSP